MLKSGLQNYTVLDITHHLRSLINISEILVLMRYSHGNLQRLGVYVDLAVAKIIMSRHDEQNLLERIQIWTPNLY